MLQCRMANAECGEREAAVHLRGTGFLLVALAVTGCLSPRGKVRSRIPTEILKQAEAEGSVNVIVEVKVGPEGIHAAQDEVLKLLKGTGHRVTRRYT